MLQISRKVQPGSLNTIVFLRRRLYRILLQGARDPRGQPVLMPAHASISCATPEVAPQHLETLASRELWYHDCLGFDEFRQGTYSTVEVPKVIQAVLKQGLSRHDELKLCSDPTTWIDNRHDRDWFRIAVHSR